MKFSMIGYYKPFIDYVVKIPKEHKLNIGLFKDKPKSDLDKYIDWLREEK